LDVFSQLTAWGNIAISNWSTISILEDGYDSDGGQKRPGEYSPGLYLNRVESQPISGCKMPLR
jgi:hypothetical protein